MRIAFLADPLDKQYGGIHIYTKEILKVLIKLDQQNEYVIVRAESSNDFEGAEEMIIPYASYPGYRFRRLFFQIPKLMVKKGLDLVVEPAHFGPFNLPKGIKRVTVIHDMTMFLFPQHHVFLSQFLQRRFLPGILRKADHIITNSANTSQDLIQLFPFVKDKTTATLLGKDERFQPQNNSFILNKYPIKQPYLLYLGTLEPRKNVITLIKAFNAFKASTGLPHQLVLVGKEGWKADDIFKEISQSPFKGSIVVPGYVDGKDLPIFYSMAEIFIYPSSYEGFGLPLLEAMACGTPVITSNVSSLPEVGGKAAHYFSPDSVEELSNKMSLLVQDAGLREKSRQLGLEQAAKFSWEQTARNTIKIFEQLS